ncbi:MAG: phosphatase PAP2 family protein [Ferruginibacter sp.]|nr:phosphatase PAP2 family protein [Ferruginibacter sp.]
MSLPSRIFFFIWFLFIHIYLGNAQIKNSNVNSTDTAISKTDIQEKIKPVSIKPLSLIIPGSMILYGVWAINNDQLKKINTQIKNQVYPKNPDSKIYIDNYLQFAPAAAVLGLNLSGIKGKHCIRDAGMIYLMSNLILTGITVPIKKTSRQLRPDSSAFSSFPSGHTAEAFASAELLSQEYRNVSPWIGIGGYSIAILTGYLRLHNNKHWFSDVVAGAGVGIISTKLSYLIYDRIQPKLFKNKSKSFSFLPTYQNGQLGFHFAKIIP